MASEKTDLNNSELRQFGLVFAGLIAGIFGLLWPWLYKTSFPIWPWLVSGIIVLLALLMPSALRYLNKAWLQIGRGLGFINTRLILGLVFYLLIVPMGIVLRLRGKKRNYHFEPALNTYRKNSEQRPINHMEKPY